MGESGGGSSVFERSWIAIDGAGDSSQSPRRDGFRIPDELSRLVIEGFSRPNDIVFDPYAGDGAILLVAQAMGRTAIGVEHDLQKVRALSNQLKPPSRVLQGEFKIGPDADVPPVDLIFTSPPNSTFGGWDDELGFVNYWAEFDRLFDRLTSALKPGGTLVFEASNLYEGSSVRPLAFEVALRLSQIYLFTGEYVRCNVSDVLAAPRASHTHLFVFRNTRTRKRKIEDVVVDKYL